ncbi:MAG: mechanosensitive ion channel [Saprospiraceae bacterium]
MKKLIILIEVLLLISFGVIEYLNAPFLSIIADKQLLKAASNFLIYLVFIDLTFRILRFLYQRKNKLTSQDNFLNGIQNIYRLLISIGIFITFFALFGLDVKSLLTSLSIVAAAIAIISKEFVNDLIVGLYYSFSSNLEINDYVKIDSQKGKIIEIGLFKIKLLNDDDDLVLIPNSKVYSNEIINYTKKDIRQMSIDFQIDLKYINSIERLEKELKKSLKNFAEYIEKDSYNLKIVEMKKDYLDLKFQYTLVHMDRDLQRLIRRKTVREVFNFITERPDRVVTPIPNPQ